MSQPSPSVDAQALLQSMLQRLRLQPGSETQHSWHGQDPHSPTIAAKNQGTDGGRHAAGKRAVVHSPVDDVRGAEGGHGMVWERQKRNRVPGHKDENEEVDKRPINILPGTDGRLVVSSPSAARDSPVLAPSPSVGRLPKVMDFTGTPVLENEDPVKTPPPSVSSLTSETKCYQNHDNSVLMTPASGFTPRVYTWSLKSTQSSSEVGKRMERWQPLGNGESILSGHSDVVEPVSLSEGVAKTSSPKTKRRLSDNITHRWTQRVKEKWRDRQENLVKKRKENRVKEKRKDTKQAEISPQPQLPVRESNVTKISNDEDMNIQTPIREGQVEAPPTLSEDNGTEDSFRSPSHFEYGLGSFSLLEEILIGQEWARFLNPSQENTSANQRTVPEATNPSQTNQSPQGQKRDQSAMTLDRVSDSRQSNSQRVFRPRELDQNSNQSADVSSTVNMDITVQSLVQEHNLKYETIQSASMEYSPVQSQVCTDEVRPSHIPVQDASIFKPADLSEDTALMRRVHLNRKRVHQAQERKEVRERVKADESERMEDNLGPSDETSSKAGVEEARNGGTPVLPLYPLKSPPSSHLPSSSSPSSASHPLVIRSILRHSVSQDSDSFLSMETATKRRRMANPNRVWFSEEVVTIPPSILNQEDNFSEEDSGTEEDSAPEEDAVMEEEVKVEPIQSRSTAVLPAWVQALKKKTRTMRHKH